MFAATRARDHLLVSLYRRPRRDCSAADLAAVLATLGDTDEAGRPRHRWLTPDADEAVIPAREPSDVSPASVGSFDPFTRADRAIEGSAAVAGWEAERAALLESVVHRSVTTPTALAAATAPAGRATPDDGSRGLDGAGLDPPMSGDSTLDGSEPAPGIGATGTGVGEDGATADGVDPAVGAAIEVGDVRTYRFGRRGHGGTAVGRAVHGVLQMIDMADIADRGASDHPGGPDQVAAAAVHQAAAEGVAERADTVASLARSALDSPAVREARRARRRWRELFVAAPVGGGGTLVEGYVDLLYETGDGRLVVVDYKTDQGRTDGELDAAARRYRLQAAAYAAVIQQVVGRPVDRCVFVFARAEGPAVERVVDGLPAAVEEVIQLLR